VYAKPYAPTEVSKRITEMVRGADSDADAA
jgi:hypothetical protein